eukprot:gene9285-1373_t
MFSFEETPSKPEEPKQEEFPIDIHYEKSKEWLINRKLLCKEWHENLKKIKQLKKQALLDMPDNEEINKIISQDPDIDYNNTKRILEILDQTEPKTTSFLGFGGNKRIKTWTYILKLYDYDNVYLAEIISNLVNKVNFEIPAKKKDISKSVTYLNDTNRKEQDYEKNLKDFQDRYKKQIEALHIKGDKIEQEIRDLVKELPDWFSKIEKEIQTEQVKKCIEYYNTFTKYFHKNKSDLLPTLQFFIKNGNVSHLEYRKYFGLEIPKVDMTKVEEYEKNIEKQEIKEIKEIDWSALDDSEIVENKEIVDIKWEDEIETSNDMDVGFSMDDIDLVHSGLENETFEIKWDDDDKTGILTNDDKNIKLVYQMKKESLLENDESRFNFLNDILELESFYQFRIMEQSKSQDLMTYMKDIPKEISHETKSDLKNYLNFLKKIIEITNDEKFKELILIKTSEKYVERITNNLKQNLELIDKMKKNIILSEEKKKSLEDEIESLKPGVERIINETKENQEFLQNQISKLLKGRRINIYGEINKI